MFESHFPIPNGLNEKQKVAAELIQSRAGKLIDAIQANLDPNAASTTALTGAAIVLARQALVELALTRSKVVSETPAREPEEKKSLIDEELARAGASGVMFRGRS